MTLGVDGVPRPDHGAGMVQRVCGCGAGWVGLPDDGCPWCAAAFERAVAEQRRALLWPDWLAEQGPTYDKLSPADRAVWDATRRIRRGEASVRAWARRLGEAVSAGIVTDVEAEAAIDRADRRCRRAG